MARTQTTGLPDNRDDTNAAVAYERRSGVQRRSGVRRPSAPTRQQKAAAAVLTRARASATERVSRANARKSLLARARSDPQSAGRLLAAERGWGGQQFECLSNLWAKESGWRWNANNPSSGAYGIPQSLPGSKMSSFGSDWASNPITQMKWGLSYISERYGTPCSAWAQSQATNWY